MAGNSCRAAKLITKTVLSAEIIVVTLSAEAGDNYGTFNRNALNC